MIAELEPTEGYPDGAGATGLESSLRKLRKAIEPIVAGIHSEIAR